jgi:hypothetical protein
MEDGLGSGRERGWHETELDERPHANREEEVDDLIGVEKGRQQPAVVRDKGDDVIGQQSVKPHVAKSQFRVAAAKLLLPVCSECGWRMAAPEGVLPAMRSSVPCCESSHENSTVSIAYLRRALRSS